MSKCRMREMEIWFKQKTRPRMNCEWIGKIIYKKKSDPRSDRKNSKIKVKLPHVNKKKPLARKRIFVQTLTPLQN